MSYLKEITEVSSIVDSVKSRLEKSQPSGVFFWKYFIKTI